MMIITITKTSAICSAGENLDEIFSNLAAGKLTDLKITAELPEISNEKYNLRCNQILLHCVNQISSEIETLIKKYGRKNVGVVIATTNTGIDKFEENGDAEFLKMSNPAEFLKDYLGLEGFFCGVSTACSSGIKVFSTAKRLMESGVCDAVIAGGTDEISKFPTAGFAALEVLSNERSIPFSKNRKGMNIGEAGAIFLLEKDSCGIQILGIGETSDAYHAATPDPEGSQAANAMKLALDEAGLKPQDIDYINLHGTGTVSNDIMEANAVYKIFGCGTQVSSTKPLTGHCLGASASIEAAICCAALEKNILLPHIYDGEYDNTLPPLNLVHKGQKAPRLENVMCNAFGFGGTNAVLILGKQKPHKHYDLENILPHNHPMILIDDIDEVNLGEGYVCARVTIREDSLFFDRELDGISYITGIEFMAQTIGCYAYFKRGGGNPKIGFLLGTRSYKCDIDRFKIGETYIIKAKEIFGDNQLVSFECFIYNNNIECASAMVNVYQPENASEFLE
ncbi:TPA: hypothetical protein IAC10_05795 [Candidatus Scatousia excrementigallinarum]|uniref:Ketosynthase family 3 (KS3) domain-containing protein n=1 Tax=Candidatus Scatousia excrementigallinarum TaxID=2840935 RepID=A0A9D1EZ88_9BACT|nr:hypothetical protein [Candidatus Scatousia excrementigallinarum]